MALISVIIPVFRVESYIIRCLESVCRQTFQDLEIILVNDCTDDDSVDIARSFLNKKEISFKIISHEYNQGLSAARNTGIVHASGEYIYFLDGDDSIKTNCLELLMNCFREEPDIDFSMAKYYRVFKNGDIKEVFSFSSNKSFIFKEEIIELYQKRILPWNAVNRLIRKKFIVENNLFFKLGLTSEDLMWNFEMLAHVNKIALLNVNTYNYYINPSSIMTSTFNRKYFYDLFYIVEVMNALCLKSKDRLLINYFLIVKYDILLEILLWNRIPLLYKFLLLRKLYLDRFYTFYSFNFIKRKLFFVLPTTLLSLIQFIRFQFNEYLEILKGKLFYKR